MIDTGPKFYAVPSRSQYKVNVTDLEFLCKSFVLKFLQCQFLRSLWWIWFMCGMVIDISPKFYVVPSPSSTWPYGQGHRTFMYKFCVTDFTMSVFAKSLMDLILVWHGDRYWSKILLGTMSIPVHKQLPYGQGYRLRILRKSFALKFGMDRHKILKCFRKEKHDFRWAVQSYFTKH